MYAGLQGRTVVHFIVDQGVRVSPEGRIGAIGHFALLMFHTAASAEQCSKVRGIMIVDLLASRNSQNTTYIVCDKWRA